VAVRSPGLLGVNLILMMQLDPGESCTLQLFVMRSMGSGGAFHRAYTNGTQQAFLEGHEHAFDYFGGVFHTLRYDNLSSAVKKILRGRQREETERVIAFRSHWGFRSEYCTPARGNEKGGVENELGWYRRNFLVPVPEAGNLAGLNALLLERCRSSMRREPRSCTGAFTGVAMRSAILKGVTCLLRRARLKNYQATG